MIRLGDTACSVGIWHCWAFSHKGVVDSMCVGVERLPLPLCSCARQPLDSQALLLGPHGSRTARPASDAVDLYHQNG